MDGVKEFIILKKENVKKLKGEKKKKEICEQIGCKRQAREMVGCIKLCSYHIRNPFEE